MSSWNWRNAVFGGVAGAGKSETINQLNQWLDPRGIVTRAFDVPSQEERERPEYWRYWLSLPPKGKIGMYLSGWYESPLHNFAYGRIDRAAFERKLDRIDTFERELADDGALLLKFWIHIDKDEPFQRFKDRQVTPYKRWKITDEDWRNREKWNHYEAAVDDMVARTNTDCAPWTLVEGNDKRFARVKVIRTMCERLQPALDT